VTAAQDRADLDTALAKDGQWIEIHRLIGIQQIPVKVRCRAFVRGIAAQDLAPGIKQDTSDVIISATEIIKSGWPGPNSSATPTIVDRRVPTTSDRALIAGKVRQIDASLPVYTGDDLVRINLRVLG
jgi:hypothetical protein